ncbi:MAG TPA: Lsr2 family protein [Acidimicrobiales bacterium]|nr:Lsr2 family protein [Acidimicrobiales bacterium]
MAKTTVTLLTCDQCKAETGEEIEAEETVAFGYDGYSYTLDLCPPHAESFHATVQTMTGWSSERTRAGTGRRTRPATTSSASKAEPRASSGTTSDRERLRAIREWARDSGYPELGNRGRIPQHIVDEYEAAHGG